MRLIKQPEDKFYLTGLILVTLLGTGLRLAYLFQPMCFDESCTYMILASKSPAFFLSNYVIYNNHPLHTLGVHLSTKILGNVEWAIRLPAFLAGVILIPVTYFIISKFFKKRVALLTAGIVAVLSPFVIYSTNARGYTMQTLFFVLALYFAVLALNSKKISNWIFVVLFTGLGCYTHPTSFYYFVPVYIWLFLAGIFSDSVHKRKPFLIHWFSASISTILLVLILYLPYIMNEGIGFLFQQPEFVRKQHIFGQSIWTSLTDVWKFTFSDISTVLGIFFVIGFILFLVFGRKISKRMLYLTGLTILWFSLLILITKLVPPQRAFLPAILLFIACSFAGINYVVEKIYWHLNQQRPEFKLSHQFVLVVIMVIIAFLVFPPVLANSIYQPRDQVTFRNARDQVLFLKPILKEGDVVLIDTDAYYVSKYYFMREDVPSKYLYHYENNPLDLSEVERIFILEASEENHTFNISNPLKYSTIPEGTKCIVSPLRIFEMASVCAVVNWKEDEELKKLVEEGKRQNAKLREKGKSDYFIYWMDDEIEIIVTEPTDKEIRKSK